MGRHRKEDTRSLGHKLLVKEEAKKHNPETFRRCRNRLPHIIKKMSEGLKQLNENRKAEEERIKNSNTETQETKETEIIEEFGVPEEKPEEQENLLEEKVLEEIQTEETKTEEEEEKEKKPDLNSFIKDLNGFSAQADFKNVEETIKNTFADKGNVKNLFSEMFSNGDKFGQAVKGFFDFVGNCKNKKAKRGIIKQRRNYARTRTCYSWTIWSTRFN